ncbi:MAG: hypothetical protein K6G11_09375, partial [Lachnospiraceae bacterium]|nr:hypothetical protein [Lachnospiraceae bacterium]
TSLAAIRVGMEILKEEEVNIKSVVGHGGLFKTKGVGDRFVAAAMETPITVMETAGEGGAFGIAVLAAYSGYLQRKAGVETKTGTNSENSSADIETGAGAETKTGTNSENPGEDIETGAGAETDNSTKSLNLPDFLEQVVYKDAKGETTNPDPNDVKGFDEFTKRYISGISIELISGDVL